MKTTFKAAVFATTIALGLGVAACGETAEETTERGAEEEPGHPRTTQHTHTKNVHAGRGKRNIGKYSDSPHRSIANLKGSTHRIW